MTETKKNIELKHSKVRQKTILNTFIEPKFKEILPKEKVKCPHCKTKILDLDKHLKKCHANPVNIPLAIFFLFKSFMGRFNFTIIEKGKKKDINRKISINL